MTGTELDIRRATLGDLARIMEIIVQAQAFLRTQGLDQWQDGYPDERVIRADIALGTGRAVCSAGRVIAYYSLLFSEEPTYRAIYSGAWKTTGAYAVIHRLAVSEDSRGRGVASRALSECAKEALAQNLRALRVDTHADNLPMRRMLESNGFEYCGVIYLESGAPRVAYDRTLTL